MFDVNFLETYGLLSLFLICFLSATILPLSSEIVVVYFLNSNTFSPFEVIMVASIGNIIGGTTNYLMGYFFSRFFKIKSENKTYRIAKKHGHIAAFFSWLPFIGEPILLALGLLKSSFWKMFIFMSLGKSIRYAFFVLFYL
jgi:membrane protein YqaA with SNARE-associated domain